MLTAELEMTLTSAEIGSRTCEMPRIYDCVAQQKRVI